MQFENSYNYITIQGHIGYFEGSSYDNNLKFNSEYNFNNVNNGINMYNVYLERGDILQINSKKELTDEGTFLRILLNNIIYI